MAAGDRPSSDIDAYGGMVSSISLVCMHPAASAIVAPTITAARADFRLRVTSFVSTPLSYGIGPRPWFQRTAESLVGLNRERNAAREDYNSGFTDMTSALIVVPKVW